MSLGIERWTVLSYIYATAAQIYFATGQGRP